MKIEKIDRISLFKDPVIALKCPNSWIYEASKFEERVLAQRENSGYLTGWFSAKRMAMRAFSSYFDIKEQLDLSAKNTEVKSVFDFTLNGYEIAINAFPVKDYFSRIGHTFNGNLYKSKSKNNLLHVICSWWCPILFIVGYVDNATLEYGKNLITSQHINPLFNHNVFKHDDKLLYI